MSHVPFEPVDEGALLARAHAATQAGDARGAMGLLRQLLEANPSHAEARHRLAHAMFAVDDREAGVEEMRRALADRPGRAAWHFELGVMLVQSGRIVEALAAFEDAERQDPKNAAYPGRIAMLGRYLRNDSVVRAAAERALRLNPNEYPALLGLAQDEFGKGRLDEAEGLAQRVIGGCPEAILRSTAMHLVGRINEKRERWDEAFEAHSRANELKLKEPMARGALREPPVPFLPYLGHADGAARYASWGAKRYDDGIPAPVIVTGFPRSGTTLCEQILAAHPGVATSEEWALCRPVRAELDAMLPKSAALRPLLEVLDELTDDQVRSLRATYRRELERYVRPEERGLVLVDKHPMRILDMGLMNRLFPETRVIFMVRDPRDVVLSAYFQNFALTPDMVRCLSLPMCADWYVKVVGFWRRLRPLLSIEVLEVRYEDLVDDFDTWAGRILETAGVAWDDAVRDFHAPAGDRMVRSASFEAVTQKLNRRSIGRWRRYASHMEPVLARLEPFVEGWGYWEEATGDQ